MKHIYNKYKEVNPCDNNLYSSFIKSEHSCDGPEQFYYTCESFEEMEVFANACAKHSQSGAKVDAPKVLATGHSRYKVWVKKVMKNRELGTGREIMYDDEKVEPGLSMSVGAGEAGDAPVTDEQLGNKVDPEQYVVDPLRSTAKIKQENNYDDEYEYDYDDDNYYQDDNDFVNENENENENDDEWEDEEDVDMDADMDMERNEEVDEVYDYDFNENDVENRFGGTGLR